MQRRLLRLLSLMLALCGGGLAHAASVLVVLSESRGPYLEYADSLRTELRKDANTEFQIIDADQTASRNPADYQMIVGVGGKAMDLLAARDFKTPLLLTLIPRSSWDKLPGFRRDDKRTTALFLDQPPARYVDLIRATLPDVERVGLLAGRDSRDSVNRFAQLARERKLRPSIENINSDSDLYPAVQRLFSDGGVLLATPDASVFNSQTIPNIILSTYRFRAPVIGYSQTQVKSGALAAVYSTPAQLGTQSAEIVRSIVNGAAAPAPQYPRIFSVGINSVVARSLGLDIESESVIHDRIERAEKERP